MPLRALLPRLVACPLLACRPVARPAVTTEAAAPESRPGPRRCPSPRSELPAEARRTPRLIDEGGPFPHERDGSVFGAFEGLLPRHENGSYREWHGAHARTRRPGRPARRHRPERRDVPHRRPYASFTAVPG
ncbi:ribonuclease domain-containing protein [Streptomyces griseoincarnatus]